LRALNLFIPAQNYRKSHLRLISTYSSEWIRSTILHPQSSQQSEAPGHPSRSGGSKILCLGELVDLDSVREYMEASKNDFSFLTRTVERQELLLADRQRYPCAQLRPAQAHLLAILLTTAIFGHLSPLRLARSKSSCARRILTATAATASESSALRKGLLRHLDERLPLFSKLHVYQWLWLTTSRRNDLD